MKNIAFVIFLLGWPIIDMLRSYQCEIVLEHEHTLAWEIIGFVLYIVSYIFLAMALFEGDRK